jgi:hypothetical protein
VLAEPLKLSAELTADASKWTAGFSSADAASARLGTAVANLESRSSRIAGLMTTLGVGGADAFGKVGAGAQGAAQGLLVAQQQVSSLSTMFPRLAALLLGPVGAALIGVAAAAGAAWALFKDDTIEAFGEVGGEAVTLSEIMGGAFTAAKEVAGEVLTDVVKGAKQMVIDVIDWFSSIPEGAGAAFEYVWDSAKSVFTRINQFAARAGEILVQTFVAAGLAIVESVKGLWEVYKTFFSALGNIAKAGWEAITTGSTEPLKAALSQAASDIGGAFSKAASDTGRVFRENLPKEFEQAWDAAVDLSKRGLKRIKDAIVANRDADTKAAVDASKLGLGDGGKGDELFQVKQQLEQKLTALTQIGVQARAALENDALDRSLQALNDSFALRKLTEQDYVRQSAELQRQKAQVTFDALAEESRVVEAQVVRLVASYRQLSASGNDKEALKVQGQIADVLGKQTQITVNLTKAERDLLQVTTQRDTKLELIAQKQRDYLRELTQGTEDYRRGIEDSNRERQFEIDLMGRTSAEQAVLRAAHEATREVERQTIELLKIDQQIRAAINDGEIVKLQELEALRAAMLERAGAAQANVAVATAQATQKVWREAALNIEEGLTNAITQGLQSGRNVGKSVRDYLKQLFNQLVLTPTIKMGVQQLLGGLGGLAGGAGGAGGGISGLLGSLFGGGGGADAITSDSPSFLSALPGLGSAGAGGGLIGSAFSAIGSAFPALGAAFAPLAGLIPFIGPLIALAPAIIGLFKNKDGLWFDFGGRADGNSSAQRDARNKPGNSFETAQGVTVRLQGEGKLSDAKAFVDQFKSLSTAFAEMFGEATNAAANKALQEWTGFSQRGRGTEYESAEQYAKALATESKDVLAEYFSRAFGVVDSKIAAQISAFSGSTEELVKFIQQALGAAGVVKQLTETFPDLKLTMYGVMNASEDQRNALALLAQTFAATNSDYIQAAKDSIIASRQTLSEALQSQNAKVLSIAVAFDGTLASAQKLAEAERTRLQMVAALIAQIAQVSDQVKAMFSGTAEKFRLAGMTPDQQYEYYDQKAKETFELLQKATDPAKIAELAARYDNYLQQGFQLLSPEQQKEKANDYATLADTGGATSQAQLDKAQASAEREAQALSTNIATAIKLGLEVVAAKIEAAADRMQTAADTPTRVVVTGSVTVELEGENTQQRIEVGVAGVGA